MWCGRELLVVGRGSWVWRRTIFWCCTKKKRRSNLIILELLEYRKLPTHVIVNSRALGIALADTAAILRCCPQLLTDHSSVRRARVRVEIWSASGREIQQLATKLGAVVARSIQREPGGKWEEIIQFDKDHTFCLPNSHVAQSALLTTSNGSRLPFILQHRPSYILTTNPAS